MANPSLAALLRAVEIWQQAPHSSALAIQAMSVMADCDIPALRAAAHQHAEALREKASVCAHCNGEGSLNIIIGVKNHNALTERRPCLACDPVRAAADFLDGKAE